MSKTITQTVKFKGVKASELYGLYMNAKKHSQVTEAPAEIGKKAGESWSAYGKKLRGKQLMVAPNKMVVQTWRAKDWDRSTPDSVLVLRFADVDDGAQVSVVHALVPEQAFASVKQGWNDSYWKKWKAQLKRGA